jgi:hypothetical protein
MIRPFTCLCLLVAAGSGLYLYQEKHRAEMLDRQIGQVVKATDAARERTGMMRAEWTLLNEPERLQDLATKYLQLQPMAPSQFVQLAGLDARLPPIAVAPPATPPQDPAPALTTVPIAQAAPAATPTVVAAAAPERRIERPAAVDIAPVAVPTAPVRMASADIAVSAPAAKPVHAAAVTPVDAHDIAAPRPAPRVVARRKPAPAPEIADASAFAPGPSAEPRPLQSRRVMAPIVDAFATPHPVQVNRAPVIQRTEALTPVVSSGMAVTGSMLGGGSVLGGGRPMLAPPVPVSQ